MPPTADSKARRSLRAAGLLWTGALGIALLAFLQRRAVDWVVSRLAGERLLAAENLCRLSEAPQVFKYAELQGRIADLSVGIEERLRAHWTDAQAGSAERMRRLGASTIERDETLTKFSENVSSRRTVQSGGRELLAQLQTELAAVASEWSALGKVVVSGRDGEDFYLKAEQQLLEDTLFQQARQILRLEFTLRVQNDAPNAIDWAEKEIALQHLPAGLAEKLRGPV